MERHIMTDRELKDFEDRVLYNEGRNAYMHGPILSTTTYRELLDMAKKQREIEKQVEANT